MVDLYKFFKKRSPVLYRASQHCVTVKPTNHYFLLHYVKVVINISTLSHVAMPASVDSNLNL